MAVTLNYVERYTEIGILEKDRVVCYKLEAFSERYKWDSRQIVSLPTDIHFFF